MVAGPSTRKQQLEAEVSELIQLGDLDGFAEGWDLLGLGDD